MDINKIEILIRAIELGSLSKAANEFLYTPSAVSHILDSIENEIGARFINRTYAGIEVKAGYEEIVSNLKKIVDIQKKTKQVAIDLNRKSRSLTIATYASLSKQVLPGIIRGFNKKLQDVHINILVGEDMETIYASGEADILFGEKVDEENVCWEELFSDPYVAIIPQQYEFSDNYIKREELYKYTFIKVKEQKISEYIDESMFEDIIHIVSHDDSSVIHMVKEEMGISILPMLSVADEKSVKCVNLNPGLPRTLGLSFGQKDYKEKQELRDFIKYIRSLNLNQSDICIK